MLSVDFKLKFSLKICLSIHRIKTCYAGLFWMAHKFFSKPPPVTLSTAGCLCCNFDLFSLIHE